jgi:hypothetical protein
MKVLTKIVLCTLILFISNIVAFAQGAEMADKMRSEGKIYVVVAMTLIVLGGMIAFLFMTDRKLNRIEKEVNRKSKTNIK